MSNDFIQELQTLSKKLDEMRGYLELDKKQEDIAGLEKQASTPGFWNQPEARHIMQHLTRLKTEVKQWDTLKNQHNDLALMAELVKEQPDDATSREITTGLDKLKDNLAALRLQKLLSGEYDLNNAIVTLHSGAGGTEACDWVEMLLRMYQRWAERKGYATEITDILPGEEAGIKSVTFIIRGDYTYGYLKSEIGVHRLVRISPFDANKRRHTSFASCDVIPEVSEDIDIVIEEKDLRIDTYRASGHGGQHVNKTESAIRITHLPTGAVVQCQNERSQFKNKAMAMKMLKAKLFELEQEKKRSQQEKHYDDKGDIAWGSQIRSYVFCPYTLVKDHRADIEVGNVEAVMDGDIDKFIQAYLEVKKK
ncbi:MAG: peptide chain release factor 2 [bacterium]